MRTPATITFAAGALCALAACASAPDALPQPYSYVGARPAAKFDNTERAYILDAVNLIRDIPACSPDDWDPAAAVFAINGLRHLPASLLREACRIYLEDGGRPHGQFARFDEGHGFKVAVLLTLAAPDDSRDRGLLREALRDPRTDIDIEGLAKACPDYPLIYLGGLPFLLYFSMPAGTPQRPRNYLDTELSKLNTTSAIEPLSNPVAAVQKYLLSDEWGRLLLAYQSPYHANRVRAQLRMQAMRCVRDAVPAAHNLLLRAERDTTLTVAAEGWQALVDECANASLAWDAAAQKYITR